MPNRVIGIGYSKTGTSTLRECFDQLGLSYLGFEVQRTREVVDGDPQHALEALSAYDAAANWPWPIIYKDIDAAYPDSQFVLTVRRDSKTWMESLKRQAEEKPNSVYREWVYGHRNPVGNEQDLIQKYERHNHEVRSYFADRPGKLLEVCWETGSGWNELCTFLNLPIPRTPFPHANRSASRKKGTLSKLLGKIGF